MKQVCVFLADGFEEVEALTVVDLLRRARVYVDTVSITDEYKVHGAHGINVQTEDLFDEVNFNEFDMIVLPGGMPGAKFLAESENVISVVKDFDNQGKYIGAICAAPALVLSKAGIAVNREVTSYPGMEDYLSDSIYKEDAVVQDNNLITSRGPATALQFSFKLVDVLGGNSEEISDGMLYSYYR